jgi:iron complex transport system ATP-binding protein
MQPTDDDRARAATMLAQLGCDHLADRPFGVLSQGEKQKVLIARARMAKPLLLVLDEPCAGMDPGARERMLAAIDRLAHDPAAPTMILVTHHVEEIMPRFRRTIVMSAGRIAAAGPTAEIVTSERLAEVYGVPVQRLETSHGRLWPIWDSIET